jgi:hypothetical protein
MAVVVNPKAPFLGQKEFHDVAYALRTRYAPELGPTVRLDGRDYPYRSYITKESFAKVMVRVVLDLDYGSFKSMVAREQGALRAHLYSQVWSAMYDAEHKIAAANNRAVVARSRRKPK